MDAAPFSAHHVKTDYSSVHGNFELPDGSELIWALSRREFGPMSFKNRPPWDVAHNRIEFLRLFDLKIDDVVSPILSHSARVREVTFDDIGRGARDADKAFTDVDALVTKETNIVLLTTHADCLPVWLCAPYSGWTGMAHVGWRGLLDGLILEFVNSIPKFEREGLTISIGPCISPGNYEIGNEVAEKFRKDPLLAQAIQSTNGKLFLDLSLGAKLQAEALGVTVDTSANLCTFDNSFLSSYRRDGDSFSPMAAIITRVMT